MTRLWSEKEAIRAWERDGAPAGFVWQGASHHILEVCNRWQVHTRWWEPGKRVWRDYFKVATDSGLLCQVYHDRIEGGWYLSRLYD